MSGEGWREGGRDGQETDSIYERSILYTCVVMDRLVFIWRFFPTQMKRQVDSVGTV